MAGWTLPKVPRESLWERTRRATADWPACCESGSRPEDPAWRLLAALPDLARFQAEFTQNVQSFCQFVNRSPGLPNAREVAMRCAQFLGILLVCLPATARVLRVPAEYATLGLALAVNQPGDTLDVAAGDYELVEDLVLDEQVTLRAAAGPRPVIRLNGHRFQCGSVARVEGFELVQDQTDESMFLVWNQPLQVWRCRLSGGHVVEVGSQSPGAVLLGECQLLELQGLDRGDTPELERSNLLLYACSLSGVGCLDSARHPFILLENCLLEQVERFGNQGWVSWDEGELRLHNCTLVDCGGVGTSLNFLELNRCLVLRPQGSLLGTGEMEPDLFEIRETDIWNGTGSCWGGSLEPLLGVYGNLEADPLFCGEAEGDFRLSLSSPCLLDSLDSMWMGAFPVGCGPLLREIRLDPLESGLPQPVVYHADVVGDWQSLEWDVDRDGQPEGHDLDFAWSWELPGDYQVELRVSGGGYVDSGLSPLLHVGGTVRPVSSNSGLRAALEEAVAGDLLRLDAGTFLAAGLPVAPGVLLVGQPGATILEGDGEQPLLELSLGDSYQLLQDLILQHGAAAAGGALRLGVEAGAVHPRLWLRRCEFRDNVALEEGGALACSAPVVGLELRLDSCLFVDNQARQGGALYGYGFQLRNCRFLDNQAWESGGAFMALDSVQLDSCLFSGNRARRGGALALEGPARLTGCSWLRNRAEEDGGAVWNAPWFQLHGAHYESCLFVGNEAGGSGAALWDHGGPRLERCTFAFDSSSAVGATADLSALAGGEPVRVERSLLTLSRSGRGLAVGEGLFHVQCTDLWGNSGGDWSGLLEELQWEPGNRRVDPRYCRPDLGDFSLQHMSPCRPEHDPDCGGLGAVSTDCPSTEVVDAPLRPRGAQLAPPWPNPFNPDCRLEFELDRPGQVRLVVLNLAGQEVARLCDERLGAGRHQRLFRGSRLASGVYLARLETEEGLARRKLLLLK